MTVGRNSLAASMAAAGSGQKRNSTSGSPASIWRTVSPTIGLVVDEQNLDGEVVGGHLDLALCLGSGSYRCLNRLVMIPPGAPNEHSVPAPAPRTPRPELSRVREPARARVRRYYPN